MLRAVCEILMQVVSNCCLTAIWPAQVKYGNKRTLLLQGWLAGAAGWMVFEGKNNIPTLI